ncbi:MAG: PAS domain S-box protein, partial [Candidatus Contendobacter sp.]|nr:PAS domain S-box protein [Candidatus Contendobacter sp.]
MTVKARGILLVILGILAMLLILWEADRWMAALMTMTSAVYPAYRWVVVAGIVIVFLAALRLYLRQRTRAATVRATSLREREQLFRTLFEQSDDANLLLDHERFFDCNAAALRMLRATDKAQVLSRGPAELSPEFQPNGRCSVEKVQEIITAAFREGSQRFEWVHCRLDGSEFWVEIVVTVIPWQDRRILHAVWRDITQRKDAEEALRASETRFRDLSALASDWFWEQDEQFRFTYFSSNEAAMMGLEPPGINS